VFWHQDPLPGSAAVIPWLAVSDEGVPEVRQGERISFSTVRAARGGSLCAARGLRGEGGGIQCSGSQYPLPGASSCPV